MPRQPTSDFDKNALIDDLKLAGFEGPIAEIIAARVDNRKAKEWTQDMGRQEALKEAQLLLKNSHLALDAFREGTLPSQPTQIKRPLADRIADSTLI